MLDNNLTKQKYINIYLSAIKRNDNIYPSYENILSAKLNCYSINLKIDEILFKYKKYNKTKHVY